MIKVHNYPSSPMTYSYITITKIDGNNKEYDSEPIYFHELTDEQYNLAIIIGICQNSLKKLL